MELGCGYGILALACLPIVFIEAIVLFANLMVTLGFGTVSLLAGAAIGKIATRGG